jgi:hypothetical protein
MYGPYDNNSNINKQSKININYLADNSNSKYNLFVNSFVSSL